MPRGGQSGCARGAAASRRATRETGAARPRRGNLPTVASAVALAFALGCALTLVSLPRAGLGLRRMALGLALAADTASIAVMEVADSAVTLAVPDAMDAGLADPLFRASLALALAVVAAFPVDRWPIACGHGHAVVHAHHGHHR